MLKYEKDDKLSTQGKTAKVFLDMQRFKKAKG